MSNAERIAAVTLPERLRRLLADNQRQANEYQQFAVQTSGEQGVRYAERAAAHRRAARDIADALTEAGEAVE